MPRGRIQKALPFILLVALAFGYRGLIMLERAAAPNEISHWDPLPPGADQTAYIEQVRDLQTGAWPPSTFYYQPGLVYMLGALAGLIGSVELLPLRLAQALLASLNCGLLAATAWRATGHKRAGILAGLLLALYPVSAFYDTDFVITSQALVLSSLMLACAWLAYERPRNWLLPLMSGLLLGFGSITRFELVGPGLVCVMWLIASAPRGRLKKLALAALGCAVIIAPVARHNRAGGGDSLITPIGPLAVYRGNNRDADGLTSPSNALSTTHQHYFFHYLLHDIGLEPLRFMELNLRKAAFFLSGIEGGNNLDFQIAGEHSRALALNPLRFPHLLLLFLAGLWVLSRAGHRRLALLLLLAGGAYFIFTMLGVVESRIKTAIVAWMMPACGYAIDRTLVYVKRRGITAINREAVVLLAAALALSAGIHWLATNLPRDVTVAALPPDATAAGLIYADTLELVGWQVREQYSPRHTFEPYHPWVVSLYWRALRQSDMDYSFSLKLIIDEKTRVAYDRPIGYTVYPRDYTSKWRTGAIYVEHIGLAFQKYDGPFEETGAITLDVYPAREAPRRITPQDSAGASVSHLVLARPAILLAPGRNDLPTDREISFGGELFLLGFQLPETASAGQTVTVRTAWRSGQEQIRATNSIGMYAFLDGAFAANIDSSPRGGKLQTFSLLPYYHFDDKKLLEMPATAGVYDIFVGVYDLDTGARLPVQGAQDNLYHIGRVKVE